MPGLARYLLIALLIALPGVAVAQPAADLVRWIYVSHAGGGVAGPRGLAALAVPGTRERVFSHRMAAFFAANDSHGDDLASACLDFGPEIPGQDFDPGEILSTLSLMQTGPLGSPVVTARFNTFGQPAQIVYHFVTEDGALRLDDIAGPGWRLSENPCAAKPASLCFRMDDGHLRLAPTAGGQTRFDLESWQAGGHSCSVSGLARATGSGWVFEDSSTARPCRIEIARASDGGVRLNDVELGCKIAFCGMRAQIDGLTFPVATRVVCADLPAQ